MNNRGTVNLSDLFNGQGVVLRSNWFSPCNGRHTSSGASGYTCSTGSIVDKCKVCHQPYSRNMTQDEHRRFDEAMKRRY